MSFKLQGNNAKALAYYEKSLAIEEEIGDKSGIATCFNNIGMLSKNQGKLPEALNSFQKSMDLSELEPGIFILRIDNENNSSQKFIKQ